jgi:Cu-Zn family superoxide dismutase
MVKSRAVSFSLVIMTVMIMSCSRRGETANAANAINEASRLAPLTITLINTKGVDVGTGVVTQTPRGIEIALEVHDLPPGKHATHIHEKAKCEAPDFESAGQHFNPLHRSHGIRNPDGPHAGDLRDIMVRSDGMAQTIISAPRLTLEDGEFSILQNGGTSVVIHADGDDGETNPSGNSGARIACGVINR